MPEYDLTQSTSDHPDLQVSCFWPSLLLRLSPGGVPVPRAASVDVDAHHACRAGQPALTESTSTISWNAKSVDAQRSDCFAAADAVDRTLNQGDITEHAAIGLALCALPALCPGNSVTRVSQIGSRADYYMNGRSDEMIEIGGINDLGKSIDVLHRDKAKQILAGAARHAWVCVANFVPRSLRLEKVR
ncbi:MAG: hypothetical protein HY815_25710 [Candidatus Riflebacteria bacterium]|nr:hypothetical protein [Candidatus Riflebacteria bacterium]